MTFCSSMWYIHVYWFVVSFKSMKRQPKNKTKKTMHLLLLPYAIHPHTHTHKKGSNFDSKFQLNSLARKCLYKRSIPTAIYIYIHILSKSQLCDNRETNAFFRRQQGNISLTWMWGHGWVNALWGEGGVMHRFLSHETLWFHEALGDEGMAVCDCSSTHMEGGIINKLISHEREVD